MSSKRIAAFLSFILTLGSGAAYAGLNDGIRPGPSPAPWLLPAAPKAPAYALTGSARRPRTDHRASGWTRETRQIGTKIVVDTFVR